MPAPGPPREPDGLEIRSFHVVFALERRLHRIDRWRLPFPYGVPVRAIAYGAGALMMIIVAGQLPLLSALAGAMPAPLRFVIVPAAIGGALARLRVDGRPAHRHLLARISHQLRPARRSGVRAAPAVSAELRIVDPVVVVADESAGAYRAARITGPAEVLLRYPARGAQRGRRLRLVQDGEQPLARPQHVTLAAGQHLVVGPAPDDAA